MSNVSELTMAELPIVYVKHGVANRYNDRIEVNEELLKYPKLLEYIIKHEREHTDKVWSAKDLAHDLSSCSNSFRIMLFILRTPTARRDLLPVYKYESRWYIDYSLLSIYVFVSIMIGVMIWIKP